MGCDIHAFAERQIDGRWKIIKDIDPFNNRSYAIFGFLAGVRNYSAVPPIAKLRGFPVDASQEARESFISWESDAHSASWLLLSELLEFDYDKLVEDRRVMRQVGPNSWDGGCTAEPGGGAEMTFKEFLGPQFFVELDALRAASAERIIFWFDN